MITIQQEIYQCIYFIKNIINVLRQTNTSIPQQINFTGKLEEDNCVTMFFITEKLQQTILNFSLDSLVVTKLFK